MTHKSHDYYYMLYNIIFEIWDHYLLPFKLNKAQAMFECKNLMI